MVTRYIEEEKDEKIDEDEELEDEDKDGENW